MLSMLYQPNEEISVFGVCSEDGNGGKRTLYYPSTSKFHAVTIKGDEQNNKEACSKDFGSPGCQVQFR